MSLSALSFAALEAACNHYLGLDPYAQQSMASLHGRVIAIEVIGLGQTLYLIPGPTQLQIFAEYEGEADCVISGTPLALSRLSDKKGSSDQLFSGDVEISGDTQLAHQLGKILGDMDIDWEEQLSRYSGDVIAHQVGNFVRGLHQWGTRSASTLGLDLQEYLQEEQQLLPVKAELDQFSEDVDHLRDDIERLQARTDRLITQFNKSDSERSS